MQPTTFNLSVPLKLANRSKRFAEAFEFCEGLSKKYGLRLTVHVSIYPVQTCVEHKDLKSCPPAVFEQWCDVKLSNVMVDVFIVITFSEDGL